MAEEKKKPDLKARLKGTMAGTPPPATASSEPVIGPPADIAPPIAVAPPVEAAPIPPPIVSGGLGGGDDIAVPDFIKQQRAEQAAAEARALAERAAAEARAAEQARLAAIAADPFSSGAAAAQEVRLVIDDKAVADHEVGRTNRGAIITAVATGFVALVAGYLIGDFKASKDEESKTRSAIGEIRRAVDTTGTTITTLKDKLDHAAAAAGIQGNEEGQQAPSAPAPAQATVDEELVTWFSQQSPEAPLGPDVYAGRVGRLRPDIVSKLMKVQIGLEQVWRDMQRHQALTSGPTLLVVRNALSEAQGARTEYQRLAVIFGPGRGEGAPPVVATLVQPTFNPDGTFTFTPPMGAPRRTVYTAGDLSAAATIGTVGIPVDPRAGQPNLTVNNLGRPWADYVGRLRSLKTRVDALVQDHHSLGEALSRAGVN